MIKNSGERSVWQRSLVGGLTPCIAALTTGHTFAADESLPVATHKSPYDGNLWERPVLLGNLWGARDKMAGSGLTFQASTTQFYQGITAGCVDQSFAYAGRNVVQRDNR